MKLLGEDTVRPNYEDAKRFISQNIKEYCARMIENFCRSLASQDGLEEDDVDECKRSIEYIQEIQILKEHLGADLLLPESLMQNISFEIARSEILNSEDLHSLLVAIHFKNICMLKDSSKELESFYEESCKTFQERFKDLVKSAHKLISDYDFSMLAEIIRKVSKCLSILNNHLNGLVEEKYKEIVQSLLHYLNGFLEKAVSILARTKLGEKDVATFGNYGNTLKLAKETPVLEDRIPTYVEMLRKKNEQFPESVTDLKNT